MNRIKNAASDRWWDIWVALFAIVIVVLVPWRLWATEWTRDLYVLVFLTFLAGLTGLALGYSRFSPLIAALFSTFYGIFCIGWLFGTTVDLDIAWRERIINELGWRLRLSIEQYAANQPVSDPILFLVIMAIFLWIMASIATFIIIRQGSVWPVLIPLGITLLTISHYDQDLVRNTRFLMTFVFLTLVLVGRVNILNHRHQWDKEGISTTHETQFDLTRSLIFMALILVILAWIIPITPQQRTHYAELWRNITEPWERFRQRFAEILVLETTTDTSATVLFGETLGLGNSASISEESILTVVVDVPPPAAYRNYWYTRSYDLYENGLWSPSPGLNKTQQYPENFQNFSLALVESFEAAYSFTSQVGRSNNLYVTGSPNWIDRPVETITYPVSPTEEDLVALLASPELYSGETYRVESQVTVPTASQLRQTETDYPSWLLRYLQLPADFSPKVAGLAESIVNPDDHPYDKAMDITRYLRINIAYAQTIPPVPSGIDPMEWFLFEEKTGFCNYYATAEVLMLRSLGIPARFAVGYAQGEYDPSAKTYNVRKMDSHAWPEVYFSGYGWIPFEPTVSQPALMRPIGSARNNADIKLPEKGEEPQLDDAFDELENELEEIPEISVDFYEELAPPVKGSAVAWVLIIVFLLMLVLIAFILQRPDLFKIKIDPLPVLLEQLLLKYGKPVPAWLRRWSYLARMSTAEKAYRRLCLALKVLGQPINPAMTPIENAELLTNRIPQAYQPVLEIVNQYHLDRYSDHTAIHGQTTAAGWQVMKMALKTRIRNIFTKKSGF